MGFGLKSAREAGKFSRRPDDTMARHDYRYRVSSVRCADSSCRARIPQLSGKLSIASRLPKRYGKQGFPNVFLKTSTSHIESDGERFSSACEVFPQIE